MMKIKDFISNISFENEEKNANLVSFNEQSVALRLSIEEV